MSIKMQNCTWHWSWTWHSTEVKHIFLNPTCNSKYFSLWRIKVVLTVIAEVLETLLCSWQVYKKWRLLVFCWGSQNQLQIGFIYINYIKHYKSMISHSHHLISVASLEIIFEVSPLNILSTVITVFFSIFSNSL